MRLFTWNIHKGIGGRDRRYRPDRIIGVLERENPDLVCLQEVAQHVRRSRFDDQPRMLARYFAFLASTFQRNVTLKTGGYGNLILSRWRFTDKWTISLRMGGRKNRGAQCVFVDTPEGELVLVNWHLGLSEHERHLQAAKLLASKRIHSIGGAPAIIAGDTNDWRNSLRKGPFADAEFESVTAPPSRYRTFPAWMPVGSLDKVFVNSAVNVKGVLVVRGRRVRAASDHLPVVMNFHLDGDRGPLR